jgi:hypothetical protein
MKSRSAALGLLHGAQRAELLKHQLLDEFGRDVGLANLSSRGRMARKRRAYLGSSRTGRVVRVLGVVEGVAVSLVLRDLSSRVEETFGHPRATDAMAVGPDLVGLGRCRYCAAF